MNLSREKVDTKISDKFEGNEAIDRGSAYSGRMHSNVVTKSKESKLYYNFEDALRNGIKLSLIPQLFMISIFAIGLTLALTMTTRQLISSAHAESSLLSKYSWRYFYMVHYLNVVHEQILMRLALDKGLVSADRYSVLGFQQDENSGQIEREFATVDFNLYTDKQIDSNWLQLDGAMSDFFKKEEATSIYFDAFFVSSLNVTMQILKDTARSFDIKMSAYSAIKLIITNAIYNVSTTEDKATINASSDWVELHTVLRNTINRLLRSLESIEGVHKQILESNFSKLRNRVLVVFITNIGTIFIFLTVSCFLYAMIISRYRSIFKCLEDIKVHDLLARIDMLTYVTALMEKEILKPGYLHVFKGTSYILPIQSKQTQLHKQNNVLMPPARLRKGANKNRNPGHAVDKIRFNAMYSRRKLYFFTLLTSIIVLGLFYLSQLVFSGIIVTSFLSKVSDTQSITNMEYKVLGLNKLLTEYRNALLEYAVLGIQPETMSNYLDKFGAKELPDHSDLTEKINSLSSYSSENLNKLHYIFAKVNSVLHSDVCSSVAELNGKEYLCKLIDVQIAQKGLLQAYFRIKAMFGKLMTLLPKPQELVEYLNSPEYIHFEFGYSHIYSVSSLYLAQYLHSSAQDYFETEVIRVYALIAISVAALFLFSSTFTILTFKDIFKVKRELTFSFQICPLEGLIENQRIRVVFLRLFKLDNQYFN